MWNPLAAVTDSVREITRTVACPPRELCIPESYEDLKTVYISLVEASSKLKQELKRLQTEVDFLTSKVKEKELELEAERLTERLTERQSRPAEHYQTPAEARPDTLTVSPADETGTVSPDPSLTKDAAQQPEPVARETRSSPFQTPLPSHVQEIMETYSEFYALMSSPRKPTVDEIPAETPFVSPVGGIRDRQS